MSAPNANSPRAHVHARTLPKRAVLPHMHLLLTAFALVLAANMLLPLPAYADDSSSASSQATEKAEGGESKGSDSSASADADADSGNSDDSADGADAGELEGNLLDPTQRADNSFIYDTTIESLFDQSSLYENSTVQVIGEVIGDLIHAGDGFSNDRGLYWITLTSTDTENKSTISVLINSDQAKQIDHYGKYGVVGTTLQVRGSYHQACPEHQGLPDIHATNVSPIARGIEHPDEFDIADFAPGILAVLLGAALMGVYYFARERSR